MILKKKHIAILGFTPLLAGVLWATPVYAGTIFGLDEELAYEGYAEVTEGCVVQFGGCLNMRSGPGIEFKEIHNLRVGTVLAVDKLYIQNNEVWYHIKKDEWIRYPERMPGEWFVAAEFTKWIDYDEVGGPAEISANTVSTSSKKIIVDLSLQKIYAYEEDELKFEALVSTGIDGTRTPRGEFIVFRKLPSRYMQGPIPGISTKEFDLPGVPWNLYFTEQGATIHGTYWHNNFGKKWSNGCVNLPTTTARALYEWAELGTRVLVHD